MLPWFCAIYSQGIDLSLAPIDPGQSERKFSSCNLNLRLTGTFHAGSGQMASDIPAYLFVLCILSV